MRLLLVEDHERFAAFVKKGLEAGGFTVDFVYNAEDVDVAGDTVDYPSSFNWNNWQPNLREGLAHLVDNIKWRVCGIASTGSPLFSV